MRLDHPLHFFLVRHLKCARKAKKCTHKQTGTNKSGRGGLNGPIPTSNYDQKDGKDLLKNIRLNRMLVDQYYISLN